MMRLLAALLALAWVFPASAQGTGERIRAYDVDIAIHADGSLDIEERIHVRAEGRQIRRGIYRDFPTRYRDRLGNRVAVDFRVREVLRDGRTEPWFTERQSNGVRVNTGNDDFLHVPADYVYTLRYRTTRQLYFGERHDELYFNAIGHGWIFPIETGSVTVRLPQPVQPGDMTAEAHTGPSGARGTNYRTSLPEPGTARWELTAPLAPREGLTIVLGFPKGIVAEPDRAQRTLWLLNDNRGLLAGLAGLVVLLAYCVRRWRAVGRDPAPGTIIARYEPPAGFAPAELRYMQRRHYDNRCFSSDLLAAAVDGAVKIHREQRRMRSDLWKLERSADSTAGPGAGDHAYSTLVERLLPARGQSLDMHHRNASQFQEARSRHSARIKKRIEPALYQRNGDKILAAVGITVVATVVTVAVGIGTGSGMLLALPLILAMIVTTAVFASLVGRPTPAGRKLLDEIEGFKRYLGVAERQDLQALQGPDAREPQLDASRFERLLPYAVALQVEDAWTGKFTLAVGAAAAAAATSSIAWYNATGGGRSDLGSMTRALSSGLTSQIASSSSPPGSSSGGGGGGFSGGGGGGGGGGGR